MTDFTIRQGGFCPVCRGIVLRDCSHTMRELRDKFASDAGRDYDSLAADNSALRQRIEEAEIIMSSARDCGTPCEHCIARIDAFLAGEAVFSDSEREGKE